MGWEGEGRGWRRAGTSRCSRWTVRAGPALLTRQSYQHLLRGFIDLQHLGWHPWGTPGRLREQHPCRGTLGVSLLVPERCSLGVQSLIRQPPGHADKLLKASPLQRTLESAHSPYWSSSRPPSAAVTHTSTSRVSQSPAAIL